MSSLRYRDRVVLITGGSSGIGAGCAREFVRAGASVVICSNREAEGAAVAESLQEIARQQSAGHASFSFCDVRNTEALRSLVESVVLHHQRLDCLINNAGWHPPHKPIDDFSEDELRELIELNLLSVFTACKAALPHLRLTKGAIINIASLVATIGQHQATTYAATKGGVTAFTKALAIDEAPNGVRVNSVSPGNIYTPMWQEAIDAASDPEKCLEDGLDAQVMGRMGTPEEVGRLCLYLAADATFTTGVDHVISGGAELGYGKKARREYPEPPGEL
jgi:NAD(P)-dependent dehydrogenase (short-subunit alcohol dehydrogenase family)